MVKGVAVGEFKKRNHEELLGELKRLREELQQIRFTKQSGTAVAKISKIKGLRRSIARVLTVINQNNRNVAVQRIRVRTTEETGSDNSIKKVEKTIKNLKSKHIPFDLRPKRTRAIRRRLTKHEAKLVNIRILKRRLNFGRRTFAVPL